MLVRGDSAPHGMRGTVVHPYSIAVLVVVVAGGLTALLPAVAEGTPFLFFFAAVMVSAWYGGLGPSLLTILLAAVWSVAFVLPAQAALHGGTQAKMLRLSLFMGVTLLMSALHTRQRRATAVEHLQREYWQTTLTSIGDAVIVTDARGNVTAMNPDAQRLTGWSLETAQGRALADVFVIVNEETRQPVEDPVRKVLRTGTVAGLANHTVLITKEGREIPIDDSAAPIRDASGQLQGIVLVFRDITARRQAEEASLRLAAIVESSDDAILSKSLDGVVTSWNVGAERLFGYRAEEMIGQPILRLLPEDRHEEEYAILERLRRGERVDPFETVRRAKDGRLLDMSITVSPLRDARGRIIGASKIARDITERKRAEEALRRAKEAAEAADRTKSEFLSTMSHELRTPLHVILGYTDMLLDGAVGDLPSQQMEIVRRIERNARVLSDLIHMVLDLNRLEAGGLPVDVRSVQAAVLLSEVQAELQGLCDQSGLACTWRVAPGLPPFHTDPGKLKVVLKNLVSNAVKFTEEGSITVAAEERQGGIEFSVTDTGIGIPAEAQAYIFEPFRQVDGATARASGGSGLGLHIVQRLLEILGGRIRVESVVGHGSTFRVWLPMVYTPRG